jgi:hypothetical protein
MGSNRVWLCLARFRQRSFLLFMRLCLFSVFAKSESALFHVEHRTVRLASVRFLYLVACLAFPSSFLWIVSVVARILIGSCSMELCNALRIFLSCEYLSTLLGGVRVLSQFSTQHSGSGFVPCECSTKLQGDELARCREVAASKQDDEHGPILSREPLQGGARVARIANGRGVGRIGST